MSHGEEAVDPLEDGFTSLFHRARRGDRLAANLVYELAFPRLRAIAARLLHRHRSHQTLQPTALAGELYLKLRGFEIKILDREHFYRISARAMRQVLTDRGRSQTFRQQQEAQLLESLQRGDLASNADSRFIIHDILQRFQKVDSKIAETIRLRFVEDCTWDELSERTGTEVWRLRDDVRFALDWMRDHLK